MSALQAYLVFMTALGGLAGIVALYFMLRLYMLLHSHGKYTTARIFLRKGETIGMLILMTVSFIFFAFGRILSFLWLLGCMSEHLMLLLRPVLDVSAAVILSYAITSFYKEVQ
ncbi:MAG: hypothetical protein DRO05_01590 [Thermoproteota archaeon]|nr:MAG: hypothetical protein DRO05_01590 [Candidatus Korarchaeota archaeon]